MKYKVVKIILLLLIFFSLLCNSVQADLIDPGQRFHEYTGIDKLSEYMKYTGIGIAVLIISLISFLSLNLLKRTSNQNDSIKGSLILRIIANISMIYLSASSMIFYSNNEMFKWHAGRRFIYICIGAIICAILVSILSIKNKEKTSFIKRITLIIAILTFVIVIFTYFNTSVGYYTYDDSYRNLFNNLLK